MGKHLIRLTENQLKRIIKESMEDYGHSYPTLIGTLIEELKYWNYDKVAKQLEDFIDRFGVNNSKAMTSQNPEITDMLRDVLEDAEDKHENEGRNWDDFDDFIALLEEVIDTYGYYPDDDGDYETLNESRNGNKKVRVTEGQLKRMIAESVKKVLNEVLD